MGPWKNEDDIKAELRQMTDELRALREGLRDLVSPPKTGPSRAFLHRHSWPTTPPLRSTADDDQPKPPRAKKPSKPR